MNQDNTFNCDICGAQPTEDNGTKTFSIVLNVAGELDTDLFTICEKCEEIGAEAAEAVEM